MKTKAAFASFLGLTLVTSILVGSTAEAQVSTSIAPRRTVTKGQLKTKVDPTKPAEEKKSPFGLNVTGTLYGYSVNEKNYIETWITGGYDFTENFGVTLETGIDSSFEKQEENKAYDLEAVVGVKNIELAKDFTAMTGLIGVLGTSRDSRDNGMTGAFGGKLNFSLKLGSVSLGLNNDFYQFAYKTSPIATPDEVELDGDEKRFYSNEYTRATTVLSGTVPVIGGLKFKNELRYRQTTPYAGEEKRPLRYRSRLIYGITDELTVLGGVSFQKNTLDKTGPSYFNEKNRTFWFQLSLDV